MGPGKSQLLHAKTNGTWKGIKWVKESEELELRRERQVGKVSLSPSLAWGQCIAMHCNAWSRAVDSERLMARKG